MVKFFCDNCNTELESEQEGYKLILPTPEFIDSKNNTSDEFYLKEQFFCYECAKKIYDLIYNRNKIFHLK